MSAELPEDWNEVTARYSVAGVMTGASGSHAAGSHAAGGTPSLSGAASGSAASGSATAPSPESGTHRIARPRALGELEAERLLPRDALSSIVTEYLSYFPGLERGAALRMVLDGLEVVSGTGPTPQALAGQLVQTLAYQLRAGRDREGFLAAAWEILAATGLRDTA